MNFDGTDIRILDIVQQDASLPVSDIAGRVGLSVTPCWRRIQRLEEQGVIRRRVALLNPEKLGAAVSVFIAIRIDQHNADWVETFTSVVAEMPEVIEFYRMSGDIDYLLRVVVSDMQQYDAFYKKLISRVKLTDVSSSFAMQQIKYTTALPLPKSDKPKGNVYSRTDKDGAKA